MAYSLSWKMTLLSCTTTGQFLTHKQKIVVGTSPFPQSANPFLRESSYGEAWISSTPYDLCNISGMKDQHRVSHQLHGNRSIQSELHCVCVCERALSLPPPSRSRSVSLSPPSLSPPSLSRSHKFLLTLHCCIRISLRGRQGIRGGDRFSRCQVLQMGEGTGDRHARRRGSRS